MTPHKAVPLVETDLKSHDAVPEVRRKWTGALGEFVPVEIDAASNNRTEASSSWIMVATAVAHERDHSASRLRRFVIHALALGANT